MVFFIIFIVLSFPLSARAQEPLLGYEDNSFENHQKVDLMLGIYRDLELSDLPDETQFKIADRKFASRVDISWDNKRKILRLVPKSSGSALITFLDRKTDRVLKQLRVFINKNDLDRVAKEIKNLLGNIEGIQIRVMSDRVVVDGQIILVSDFNRIVSVLGQYGPGKAVSLVQLSPLAMTKIASLIERDINNPQITVRVVNGFFILEGVARDLDERDEALRIAQAYMPPGVSEYATASPFPGMSIVKKKIASDGEFVLGNVLNHLRIQPEPPSQPPKVVQIIVHYVELQKSYVRGFSFQWIPTLGDGTQLEVSSNVSSGATSIGGTITAIIQNLLPKLNWAREHGHARILQSVSMIVENGNPGKFVSQREIPFQVTSPTGVASAEKSQVGINATVTPTITGARSDIVSMKIDFSVGELLEQTAAGPITSNNQVVTNITVRSGQSAAIGGLVTSRSSTGYNRMPDSATNPLLKLYASKDFNRGQSQFVVFVTPMIKSSASAGVDNVKRKFRLQK